MKLINSRKVITKILENSEPESYDFFENEEQRFPCWEIKIDRDRGDMVFLIDAKEVYSHPIKKLNTIDLEMERIICFMNLFKSQDLNSLEKELNGY